MEATSILAALAAVAFLAVTARIAVGDAPRSGSRWMLPAAVSLGFLLFSLYTISVEGPTGFWTEHTRNLWGNQIWFDLLLGVGVAWYFLVPQARAVGMRPLPWLAAVASTGCIGLLAMTARVLYLQDRKPLIGA